PIRIYTLRGLRLETTTGIKRNILKWTEKIAMACSTQVLAISKSLKHETVKMNLTRSEKIDVIGKGSSNGIDLSRFNFEEKEKKIQLKKELGLSTNDFILGYVGRLTKDKGIELLIKSFEMLEEKIM